MKSINRILLIYGSLVVGAIACKKDKHLSYTKSPVSAVTLSKSTVKMGEPLLASIDASSSANAVVRWSVNPGASSFLSSSWNASTIFFSNPGRYTITANYYADSAAPHPYDSSSSPVNVNDSIYTDTVAVHCDALIHAPVAGDDVITLTPLYNKDTGLVLIAHTQKMYPDVPSLGYLSSGDAAHFNFSITGITEYPCAFNTSPGIALAVISMGNPANGTYPLTVSLLGVTYSGTVTVSSSAVTFAWNYSTGVILSSLVISK